MARARALAAICASISPRDAARKRIPNEAVGASWDHRIEIMKRVSIGPVQRTWPDRVRNGTVSGHRLLAAVLLHAELVALGIGHYGEVVSDPQHGGAQPGQAGDLIGDRPRRPQIEVDPVLAGL